MTFAIDARFKFALDLKAFDRPVDKVRKRNLSKFGSFVRRGSRGLIRKRKKASHPGQPPSAHSSDKVKTPKFILFAWDPTTKSVVVGQVKLNSSLSPEHGDPMPTVWELGGRRVIRERQVAGRWVTAGRGRRKQGKIRHRTVVYKKRPAMVPAFNAEKSKFPDLWKDTITP